jgi:hypothetical protein
MAVAMMVLSYAQGNQLIGFTFYFFFVVSGSSAIN